MHEHDGESNWTEFLELLASQAHWGFEITTSIVQFFLFVLILRPAVNRWVANHDRTHHNKED